MKLFDLLPSEYSGSDFKNPLAYEIWKKTSLSVREYTDDSTLSKFFQPEKIFNRFVSMAAGFACILYSPRPSYEEIKNSQLYHLLLFLMGCGMQISLKERNILLYNAPFTVQTDRRKTGKIIRKVLGLLTKEPKFSPAVDEVMTKLLASIAKENEDGGLDLPGKKFEKKKFKNFTQSSICFGYFFTKEMIL